MKLICPQSAQPGITG